MGARVWIWAGFYMVVSCSTAPDEDSPGEGEAPLSFWSCDTVNEDDVHGCDEKQGGSPEQWTACEADKGSGRGPSSTLGCATDIPGCKCEYAGTTAFYYPAGDADWIAEYIGRKGLCETAPMDGTFSCFGGVAQFDGPFVLACDVIGVTGHHGCIETHATVPEIEHRNDALKIASGLRTAMSFCEQAKGTGQGSLAGPCSQEEPGCACTDGERIEIDYAPEDVADLRGDCEASGGAPSFDCFGGLSADSGAGGEGP